MIGKGAGIQHKAGGVGGEPAQKKSEDFRKMDSKKTAQKVFADIRNEKDISESLKILQQVIHA